MHVLVYGTKQNKTVSDKFHVKFYFDEYPNYTKVAQILYCWGCVFCTYQNLTSD